MIYVLMFCQCELDKSVYKILLITFSYFLKDYVVWITFLLAFLRKKMCILFWFPVKQKVFAIIILMSHKFVNEFFLNFKIIVLQAVSTNFSYNIDNSVFYQYLNSAKQTNLYLLNICLS